MLSGCSGRINTPAETTVITAATEAVSVTAEVIAENTETETAETTTETTEAATETVEAAETTVDDTAANVDTAAETVINTAEPPVQPNFTQIAAINATQSGYVNFDSEYIYYVNFDESTAAFDENTLCKRRLDGTGEEIVLVDETNEIFYQKIHAVNVMDGRVYFSAIPTPQDYANGTDGFLGYLFSVSTEGGDVRLELRDHFGYIYAMDGAIYYSIATEAETPSEWYIYNLETEEKTAVPDPFNLPETIDNLYPKYRYGDYVICTENSNFGKNLFVVNTDTNEKTIIEQIDSEEDRYVNASTIYNGKLYYYTVEGLDQWGQIWHLRWLNVFDFETKTSEKVHGVDYTGNEHFNWNQVFLYSAPNGLYEYNADGKIVSVDTSGWHSSTAIIYEP
jgi:hypothetical protein